MSELNMRDKILNAAENRVRSKGYHCVSFRDIANEVGIKSASVHYHFPTKDALMEALVAKYSLAAKDTLSVPLDYADAICKVAALFKKSLLDDRLSCLCGMFAAEHDVLPEEVQSATASYFEMVCKYLNSARNSDTEGPLPIVVISSLEGGLILSRSLGEEEILNKVVEELLSFSKK